MRSIALMNQKGGVGKTTTAVNLGAALAERGKKVILMDMDPQANLSTWLLGPASEDLETTMAEVLQGAADLADVIVPTPVEGLGVLPADLRLSGTERALAGEIGAETILRNALRKAQLDPCVEDPSFDLYDYLLIDCPPSIGMLTVNALVAATEIIIPLQAQVLALNGVANLCRVIEVIKNRLHPGLEVTGILLSMTDGRTNLAREVEESARRHFPNLVLKTTIRDNVRVAECPSHSVPLNCYAPHSPAVRDFRRLAEEIIEQEEALLARKRSRKARDVSLQETA